MRDATVENGTEHLALASAVETDVAIIGGGFTGVSAEYHISKAGMSVCLVEAKTIGHGGSGRNVGLVNAGLWTPKTTFFEAGSIVTHVATTRRKAK